MVLTFDPHPAAILRPDLAPRTLTTGEVKAELVAALGVDAMVVLKFDMGMSRVGVAKAFLDQLVTACNPLAQIAVGWDWTFGFKREGRYRVFAPSREGDGVPSDGA